MAYDDRPPTLHAHAFHEFYYCEAGDGWQFTEAGRQPMRTGDLWCFPAGCRHIGQGLPHGRSTGLVLNLPEDAVSDLAGSGAASHEVVRAVCALVARRGHRLPLSTAGRTAVRRELLALVDECRGRQPGWRAMVVAGLHRFLTVCQRDARLGPLLRAGGTTDAGAGRLDGLLAWLRLHHREPVDVARAAALAGLSRSQFHVAVRRETGTTFARLLRSLRLETARERLRAGAGVLEAALDAGFASLSQFHLHFRAAEGVTPRAWARRQTEAQPEDGPG